MVKFTLSIAILTVLAPSASWAFELGANDTPMSYAQRGLTLRQGQIRIDAGPPDFALLDSGARNQGRSLLTIAPRDFGPFNDTIVSVGFGGAYGVLDELEVGTLFIPITLSPSFEFLDMEFYGRFKFLEGEFELAAQAAISLPTNTAAGATDFALVAGAPAIFHMADDMRLDVGAELEIILGDSDVVNLDVPGVLQYQITETFFAGPKAGIFLPNIEEFWIGVGGVAGFTLAGPSGGPLVDIVAELYWPTFLASGLEDAINIDQFNLVLGARVFFSMFPSTGAPPPAFGPPPGAPPPPPPETDF